jgi:hypothetical protein
MDQFKINGDFTTMKAVPDYTRKDGKSDIPICNTRVTMQTQQAID